jgi:hypothetical protein
MLKAGELATGSGLAGPEADHSKSRRTRLKGGW